MCTYTLKIRMHDGQEMHILETISNIAQLDIYVFN